MATALEVIQALLLGVALTLALPVLAPAWSILLSIAAAAGAAALNLHFYSKYDAVLIWPPSCCWCWACSS
ncbi:hypothetical protein ACHMW6_26185 [Pseudoduganella sp. UC29_106]|uniref:hypothetical protein n=1 Tax=Pseudoduganella sp. UC29_106 TaxID=3374553 RepID=UPI003757DFC7